MFLIIFLYIFIYISFTVKSQIISNAELLNQTTASSNKNGLKFFVQGLGAFDRSFAPGKVNDTTSSTPKNNVGGVINIEWLYMNKANSSGIASLRINPLSMNVDLYNLSPQKLVQNENNSIAYLSYKRFLKKHNTDFYGWGIDASFAQYSNSDTSLKLTRKKINGKPPLDNNFFLHIIRTEFSEL